MSTTATTTQTVQIAVRATPEQIWAALTDGATTPAYYIGFTAELELEADTPYRYTAGGRDMITGTVLAVEPGRSLTTTFNGKWAPDVAELPESKVTFSLFEPPMPTPGVTFLSMVHEGLPDTEAAAALELGWAWMLSGLKTLLETGAPMVAPPLAGTDRDLSGAEAPPPPRRDTCRAPASGALWRRRSRRDLPSAPRRQPLARWVVTRRVSPDRRGTHQRTARGRHAQRRRPSDR